jgi:lysophospholipase L1-like esterase
MIDLWGYDIGWFVWFCAAGKSFFPGVGLLILSAIPPSYRRGIWINLPRYAFIILGSTLIFLSATPLYWWFYVIWVLSFAVFFHVVSWQKKAGRKDALIRIIFILVCLIAFAIELSFHFSPRMPRKTYPKLYVIGDSVSAGIGGKGEKPWPAVLGKRYNLDVTNLAVAGATVGSAIPQANRIADDNAIVLLEIGGNDLFGPTPPVEFEKNLRTLLHKTANLNRAVIMLELPLASWHIRYGRIQRKLAGEFGVVLIPKSFFANVLSTKGATVDLAHLSPEGHKIMADKVWSLLGKSLQVRSGDK